MSTSDAEIQAELSAIEGEFIARGEGPPRQEPEPPKQDWKAAAAMLVVIVDRAICPNWELTPGEKDALMQGFDGALSAFFPSVPLDPRIQALLALAGTFGAIAVARFDVQTGQLKPMRVPPPEQDGNSADAPS